MKDRGESAGKVLILSGRGVQYNSANWRDFVSDNNLAPSLSLRGNRHNNAVAESFFSLLNMERIKRKSQNTCSDARAETFYYIDFFYNPNWRPGNSDGISPVEFEKRYYEKLSRL